MALKEIREDSRGNKLYVENNESAAIDTGPTRSAAAQWCGTPSIISPEMMKLALEAETKIGGRNEFAASIGISASWPAFVWRLRVCCCLSSSLLRFSNAHKEGL